VSRMHNARTRITITRYVDERCARCGGTGDRLYGSTATWRGGIGGAAMTTDVCDSCWGSGDTANPWDNKREADARTKAEISYGAQMALAAALGADFSLLFPAQRFIADELEKLARKRKLPAWTEELAGMLSKQLRAMAEAAEAKGRR
jgi:hypothetical protein